MFHPALLKTLADQTCMRSVFHEQSVKDPDPPHFVRSHCWRIRC